MATDNINTITPSVSMSERGMTIRNTEDLAFFAAQIQKSGFAPKGFETKAQIVVALQFGAELGLTPMWSLQNLAVINGRPGIFGDAGTALVRASGELEDAEERYEGEGDELTAICRVKRRGQATWIESRFSVADAKAAGLWGKAGPWKTYPKRMLMWRARSWSYRDGFADVLKGLHFVEELRDEEPRNASYDIVEPSPPRPGAVSPESLDSLAPAEDYPVKAVMMDEFKEKEDPPIPASETPESLFETEVPHGDPEA